ncbi:fructose-bisphosphate aldolase [Purpureocillium lavendulum]|uniref:Fructose-bisphosphate aldolase n=1 Tax=Purpureocillium lavendulum TaxID=1247861 RepID=A0AB34G281_9HYPO|nr:fructose-bisphosphate aldolase [Purpureocillium lavendulum]
MYRGPRSFSTSARVHPSFLPHLRHSRHMSFRWLKPIIAVSVAGFAVKAYVDAAGRRRAAQMLAAERDAAERLRRDNALLDVYGDRSSLEALEKAVEFYEKRR